MHFGSLKSFAAYSLLLVAAFLPAVGIAFFYRRERRKLLKKNGWENAPFVYTKMGSFVQHNGTWFVAEGFVGPQRLEQLRHFALRDDDIFVVSFPRSGSICILYHNK